MKLHEGNAFVSACNVLFFLICFYVWFRTIKDKTKNVLLKSHFEYVVDIILTILCNIINVKMFVFTLSRLRNKIIQSIHRKEQRIHLLSRRNTQIGHHGRKFVIIC